MIRCRTNPQGESGLLMEVSSAAYYAQGRHDRAKGRIGGVSIERDCLTVLFVLLCPPADANGSDGCRKGGGDVRDGDFAVLKEGEIGFYEGLWQQRGAGVVAFEI